MKKFLVALVVIIVVLAALGGTALWFGWAENAVAPLSVGVLVSKTNGVDPVPLENGHFTWKWERLIPGNTRVINFSPSQVTTPIDYQASLPSGKVYADFAGIATSFDYRLEGAVTFSVRDSALPGLVKRGVVQDESSLESFQRNMGLAVAQYVESQVLLAAGNADKITGFVYGADGTDGAGNNEIMAVEAGIAQTFPALENIRLTLKTVEAPDLALYASCKSLYTSYIAQQEDVLKQAAVAEAKRRVQAQIDLDELSRYGELLTKYPALTNSAVLDSYLKRAE
jgi:hypothetical protein